MKSKTKGLNSVKLTRNLMEYVGLLVYKNV